MDVEFMQFLVSKGADLTYKDDHGNALWHASVGGNSKVVRYLVASGVEVNEEGLEGMTPLHRNVFGIYNEVETSVFLLVQLPRASAD